MTTFADASQLCPCSISLASDCLMLCPSRCESVTRIACVAKKDNLERRNKEEGLVVEVEEQTEIFEDCRQIKIHLKTL